MNFRDGVILLLLLLWKIPYIRSIRLKELRVPPYAAAGGDIQLICRFSLDGDILYSVKWYKDNREFYRYVPMNKYPATSFNTEGVHVDMTRSASDVVTLVNVDRSTEGMYSCEVSGEAPLFTTVAEHSYLTVHILPETGPRAKGLQTEYRFGEQVFANCTSAPSYPEAQLMWRINGKPAPNYYLQGPWKRVKDDSEMVESMLQLKFIVKPLHFKNDIMKLKCQAIIPPLYKQETVHIYQTPRVEKEPESTRYDHVDDFEDANMPIVDYSLEDVLSSLSPPIIIKEPHSESKSKATGYNIVLSRDKLVLLTLLAISALIL